MTVDEMKAELRRQAATWFNNAALLVLESFIAEYDKLAARTGCPAGDTARIEFPDGTAVTLFQGEHGGAGSTERGS